MLDLNIILKSYFYYLKKTIAWNWTDSLEENLSNSSEELLQIKEIREESVNTQSLLAGKYL